MQRLVLGVCLLQYKLVVYDTLKGTTVTTSSGGAVNGKLHYHYDYCLLRCCDTILSLLHARQYETHRFTRDMSDLGGDQSAPLQRAQKPLPARNAGLAGMSRCKACKGQGLHCRGSSLSIVSVCFLQPRATRRPGSWVLSPGPMSHVVSDVAGFGRFWNSSFGSRMRRAASV